ncbi:choline/ethanolamine transporter FLVCR2-like [Styela clava]
MEYKAYPIRWAWLTILWIGMFNHQFTTLSYGIINNVVSYYFKIGAYEVDILGIISDIFSTIAPFIVVVTGRITGVRSLFLYGLFAAVIGIGADIIGFMSRNFYWMVLMGQALIGISGSIFYLLVFELAASWFPANERATAIGIAWTADNLGGTLSALYFPYVLQNTSDATVAFLKLATIQNTYFTSFGLIFVLLLFSLVVGWLYIADHPPSPPSASQQTLLESERVNSMQTIDIIRNLTVVRDLCLNSDFAIITVIRGFQFSVFGLTIILVSSMLLRTFPDLSDQFGGNVRTMGTILASILSILVGRYLDKYGHYKGMCIAVLTGIFVSSVSVYFGHLFKEIYTVAIFYIVVTGIRGTTAVCLGEYLLEVTYPTNNVVVMALYNIPSQLVTVIMVSLERFLMERYNETSAVFVPIIANGLSVLLLACTTSNYRRSKIATKFSKTRDAEEEPLTKTNP